MAGPVRPRMFWLVDVGVYEIAHVLLVTGPDIGGPGRSGDLSRGLASSSPVGLATFATPRPFGFARRLAGIVAALGVIGAGEVIDQLRRHRGVPGVGRADLGVGDDLRIWVERDSSL